MIISKLKIFILSLLLLAGLVWGIVFQLPDSQLHLVFCDVGQGDAILITHRHTQVLIDGGPDEKVLACLEKNIPFYDRDLEMVVLTHPEKDHFGGLISVIERYNVKYFVSNGLVKDNPGFWKFHQLVIKEKALIYFPQKGEQIKVGKIIFFVLWPNQKLGNELVWQRGEEKKEKILGFTIAEKEINDTSLVLKLAFGEFTALFPGDISRNIETKIEDLSPVKILKVAHHGSKYSTSQDFLQLIKPQLAVISVGKNSYGHPSLEVLDRLQKARIKTFRTDQGGEIEIVSDGKELFLKRR